VTALDAPAAIGPYSHAVRAGDLLFCSGMIGLDAESGELVDGGIAAQSRRALQNLSAICAAGGAALGDAVRLTVYLTDMADFAELNDVYATFFEGDPPARVTIAVAGLPKAAAVEIDAVIALPG
jgi:2-iminobutanoate/2-iminopropanoate deaminase